MCIYLCVCMYVYIHMYVCVYVLFFFQSPVVIWAVHSNLTAETLVLLSTLKPFLKVHSQNILFGNILQYILLIAMHLFCLKN